MGDNNKIFEFKCKPKICLYNSDNYKIYGAEVDKDIYPNIKLSKYGSATIKGNMHELGLDIDYHVHAKETKDKYGYGYEVTNIRRDRPMTEYSTKRFLYEILTYDQADVLYKVYPDIVDRVVNNRLDDIDLSKLYNIKETRFKVIQQKIIENFALAGLVDKFDGLITMTVIKKLNEKYASVKKIENELKTNPYKCLCGISGIGFKKADSILLHIENVSNKNIKEGKEPIIDFGYDLKTSRERVKSCILYTLSENENNGNTSMDITKLRKEVRQLASEGIDYFVDIIKNDKEIYFDVGKMLVALKYTYEVEMYLANRIIEGLQMNTVWNFEIEKYTEISGVKLTNTQQKALEYLCKYNIMILNGFSGSGKSQTTGAIIKMLKDNKKSFALFSPTGRAAKIISGYTKEPAYTIHKGLGFSPKEGWYFNEENKLECDVLVVDEFSMVDIYLFKALLDAIDFKRTKLLMVGDSAQIPSVGAGNCLHDLMNSNMIPTITLTEIFRYGKGGIMTVGTNMRESEEFVENDFKSHKIFGEDKSYMFVYTPQEKLKEKLKQVYEKLLQENNPEDVLVLSSYNKGDYGTVAINNELQPIANNNVGSPKFVQYGGTKFYENDLVIQTVNNYNAKSYKNRDYINEDYLFEDDVEVSNKAGVFIPNGEIGKIVKIERDEVVINFDGEMVSYSKEDFIELKLAYSISTHKSQGSQCKNIVLLTPKAHTFMLNSNLMYVGATRATTKCIHLGEPMTVNRALKKKANFDRKTFMKELLKNKIKL